MPINKFLKHIVIITDCKDVAFCEMRRTILKECSKLGNEYTSVEPLVPAEEFSIINGAFLTRLMAEHYDKDVIFMLVLNPAKVRPKRIFGELNNGVFFEGADTGTLSWLFRDFGIKYLYEIKENKFFPFGGKFVHAPTVARMASGTPFEQFGNPIDPTSLIDFKIAEGAVVHIDNFGLAKINTKLEYPDEEKKVQIYLNGKKSITADVSVRMMNKEDGAWVLYPGSSLGLAELGKVRCKAGADELGVKIGDVITWKEL